MISTLIYSSVNKIESVGNAFDREMDKIREIATIRNEQFGITGFLFYFDQRFVQILEGEFESVSTIYSNIRREQRHDNVRIIWFSETDHRDFEQWSMNCSMTFIEKNHAELSIKLKFINRFLSDTTQQPIMLRDLLVSVAHEMQRRKDFPRPYLVSSATSATG